MKNRININVIDEADGIFNIRYFDLNDSFIRLILKIIGYIVVNIIVFVETHEILFTVIALILSIIVLLFFINRSVIYYSIISDKKRLIYKNMILPFMRIIIYRDDIKSVEINEVKYHKSKYSTEKIMYYLNIITYNKYKKTIVSRINDGVAKILIGKIYDDCRIINDIINNKIKIIGTQQAGGANS